MPIAVTALDESAIEKIFARDLFDVTGKTPNLVLTPILGNGTTAISIRGMLLNDAAVLTVAESGGDLSSDDHWCAFEFVGRGTHRGVARASGHFIWTQYHWWSRSRTCKSWGADCRDRCRSSQEDFKGVPEFANISTKSIAVRRRLL